jgi:hypothetical protein
VPGDETCFVVFEMVRSARYGVQPACNAGGVAGAFCDVGLESGTSRFQMAWPFAA